MKRQLSDEKNKAIIKALDKAIENGPWDQSNFLIAIGKKLKKIRDDFISRIKASSSLSPEEQDHLAARMALRSNQKEIYISLYSSDGSNMNAWEKIITNLPRQVISRPIYENEEHIKTLLKTKENKQNEAYVAVYINQDDILTIPPERAAVDKLGNILLTLKDNSLSLENISRFVHQSGIYQFIQFRLVKT